MSKSISESEISKRYRYLDEIDHVLQKSGMWIGNKSLISETFFVVEDNKIVEKELQYIPGLLKIIDEIISNSVDEYRRSTNLGLTEITVQMIGNNKIVVSDNGGIPVVIHPETNTWLPQFLFGNLRTSSNYNEDEDRMGVGTNGVGSALTNILSSEFSCITADDKNSCEIHWSNNMRNIGEPKISKSKEHFTTIEFMPDLKQFGIDRIPFDFTHILRKRCLDAAAGTIGLKVIFEVYVGTCNEPLTRDVYQFESFQDYIKMYDGIIDKDQIIYDSIENKWEFAIVPESNIRVGFVNGASCNSGTHIRLLEWWCENIVSEYLKKKHKLDIAKRVINNNYSIFVKLNVINPTYDSQTKENLTTNDYHFDKSGTYHKVTDSFTKRVEESNLVLNLVDWHKQKEQAEKSRELRKMNKELKAPKYISKLVEANSKDRSECELWVFEGDAAESGFRANRTPAYQASYKLRGVVKNTVGKEEKAIFANREWSDLISAIGLKFGENNTSKLRYKKIIICTDMDHDGNKIAALIFAFFWEHFPEVIRDGMLFRALAPVIIATRGTTIHSFFTLDEYRKHESELEGFRIKYVKGHGGLAGKEYKTMLQNKHLMKMNVDDTTDELIRLWFSGSASQRKALITKNRSKNLETV